MNIDVPSSASEVIEKIPLRLRGIRRRVGLTQDRLSEKMAKFGGSLAGGTWSPIERGDNSLVIEKLIQFCIATQTTPNEVLSFPDRETSQMPPLYDERLDRIAKSLSPSGLHTWLVVGEALLDDEKPELMDEEEADLDRRLEAIENEIRAQRLREEIGEVRRADTPPQN